MFWFSVSTKETTSVSLIVVAFSSNFDAERIYLHITSICL